MGQFNFKIHKEGQVCLKSGSGTYIVQRKVGDNQYIDMVTDHSKLKISPANTCVLIPFSGEYRIEWPDGDCCPNDDPDFELVNPFDQKADLVCIKPKGLDANTEYAWIIGCTNCHAQAVSVSLFTLDGTQELSLSDYLITPCC